MIFFNDPNDIKLSGYVLQISFGLMTAEICKEIFVLPQNLLQKQTNINASMINKWLSMVPNFIKQGLIAIYSR